MSQCKMCGEEITFRYISGRCTPIHLSGSCGDWSPYSVEEIRKAKKFVCRSCGKDCWLVHHNGGSVWVDELGPPWPKHICSAQGLMTTRRGTQQSQSPMMRFEAIAPDDARRLSVQELERMWITAHRAGDKAKCEVIKAEQVRRRVKPKRHNRLLKSLSLRETASLKKLRIDPANSCDQLTKQTTSLVLASIISSINPPVVIPNLPPPLRIYTAIGALACSCGCGTALPPGTSAFYLDPSHRKARKKLWRLQFRTAGTGREVLLPGEQGPNR